LGQQLNTLAQGCKDKLLTEVSRRANKTHEDRIKEMLHNTLNNLEDGLAAKLKDDYIQQIEIYN